jgi:hypothetical protein
MVLIQLDIIEFLLIYRYLQNTYWFKRENQHILPKNLFPKVRIGHVKGKFIFPVISMLSLWGYLKGLGV